jgi:hypothetical protein
MDVAEPQHSPSRCPVQRPINTGRCMWRNRRWVRKPAHLPVWSNYDAKVIPLKQRKAQRRSQAEEPRGDRRHSGRADDWFI